MILRTLVFRCRRKSMLAALATALLGGARLEAATFTVTVFTDTASGGLAGTGAGTAGDLRYQILAANTAGGTNTIDFTCGSPPCTITLGGPLPPITSDLTIDGGAYGNIIIDGASSFRVFFVDTGTVALSNLQIQNASAQGGAGGNGLYAGGGGGAGLGGGLFINQSLAVVTLTHVLFSNCSAQGGAGGATASGYAGGGGGGLAFPGGDTVTSANGGPGGGGVQGAGQDPSGTDGGNGGAGGGGGGGRDSTAGSGGSAYASSNPGSAGASSGSASGGNGGFGGGGGGSGNGAGGNGGFGGGGGGTRNITPGNGGAGGGGGAQFTGGTAGTGGALGSGVSGGAAGTCSNFHQCGGGGGAAAGPAVLINAGSLTVVESAATGSSAAGGAGGTIAGIYAAGAAGTASSASVYNYAGTINSSTTAGPSTALDSFTTSVTTPGATPPSPFAGQAVSLSATATANNSSAISGTMAFYDGATLLGSNPINGSGTATFSVSAGFAGGTHTITAAFTPAASDVPASGSTSDPLTLVVTQATPTVGTPAATGTPVWGQSVTLSASVTSGTGMPTGAVTFLDGATPLAMVAISAGAASFSTSTLALGPHSITAHYLGDIDFTAATSAALTLNISKATPSIATPVASGIFAGGQSVNLSVSVTSGLATPTGSVTFLDGATPLATATLGYFGTASFSTSALAVGVHTITAQYLGDSHFTPATSAPMPLTITPPVPPSLSLSTLALNFTLDFGAAAQTSSQSLTITANVPVNLTASSPAPWLIVPAGSASTPATLTVTVNMNGLAPGFYQAILSLTSAGVSARIPVTLTVIGLPQLVATPSALTFKIAAGQTAPVSQTVLLTSQNRNPGFSVSSSVPWITVTGSPVAQIPSTLTITIDPAALPAGANSANLIVTAPDAVNSPLTIPIAISLLQGGPVINAGGLVNAASLLMGPGAPDTIMSAFGQFSCGGAATILVDGQPAEILGAAATQINFVLPLDVAGKSAVSIEAVCGSEISAPVQLPVSDTSPAIFTSNQTGTGQIAAINRDGAVNGAAHPAAAGTYLAVFVSGFGVLTAPGGDGLAHVALPVSAWIGAAEAMVLYAGEAPGFTHGLQQINILIPAGVTAGNLPVRLVVGGTSTQAGATVAVQ